MRFIGHLTLILLTLALAAGLVSPLQGYANALAAFRLEFAALAVLFSLVFWFWTWRWLRYAVIVFAIYMATTTFTNIWKEDLGEGPSLTVYQKNIKAGTVDLDALLADLAVVDPDFITLQELPKEDTFFEEKLATQYPHQLICRSGPKGRVGIVSKWPLTPAQEPCETYWGVAKAVAETPLGAMNVISIHLFRPFYSSWFTAQNEQAAAFADLIPTDEPFVIGGDFNAVPWSIVMTKFLKNTDAVIAEPFQRSVDLGLGPLPLPIDHILVSNRQEIGLPELRPEFGSDHRGLIARFR